MKQSEFILKTAQLCSLIERYPEFSLNKEIVTLCNEIKGLIAEKGHMIREENDLSGIIESKERFRKLFEDSADATLIIENNNFVDCNKATLKMLRMESKEQVFNTHPSKLSPEYQPDGQTSMEKAELMMELAFSQGSNRFEWIHTRADGEEFWAEVLLTRIHHKQKPFLHCVWRDITDRKIAEKALKTSEESYKFLFEQAADGILVGNNHGIIIKANASIVKITGYSIDQLLGNSINMLFPENELISNPLRYDLVQIGTTVLRERIVKKADGSLIMVEMHTKKIGDGRLQAYMRDITARKKYEQDLLEKNIELENARRILDQANTELTALNSILEKQKAELEIAKEKAEESDRLKSAFLANMSHEIRTPMNGILGFAELLREPGLEGDTQEYYLEIIEQSGYRMLNILNNLIDISKIESGQVVLYPETINIQQLLENLHKFFLLDAQKKNISLVFNPDSLVQPSQIFNDRTKLSQILSNLIKNAIKFTQKGTVEFGYRHQGDFLEFYVSDEGIGIDAKHKTEIFERFRQLNHPNHFSEGAGLGLPISKAFVELMGGRIWVESGVEKGTIFYFNLPLK